MSFTTRKSIQWNDNPPTEPTDTLVLTSPGKHYVDIRLVKGSTKDASWAFCGKTTTVGIRTSFTHEIDSTGQEIEDAGDFTLTENGDLKETGAMTNAETGREENYIEIWSRLDPNNTTLTRLGEGETIDSSSLPFHVLQRTVDNKVTGKIVRLGHWVQGVAVLGDSPSDVQFIRGRYSGSGIDVLASNAEFPSQLLGEPILSLGTEIEGWKVTESSKK